MKQKNLEIEGIIKGVVLGDVNSGKTCLLEQYRKGEKYRSSEYLPYQTLFGKKVINENKLQIWDTCGKFGELTQQDYLLEADFVIITVNTTASDSLNNLKKHLINIDMHTDQKPLVYIVATKCDIKEKVIDQEKFTETVANLKNSAIKQIKRIEGIYDISTNNNTGIKKLFEKIIDEVQTEKKYEPLNTFKFEPEK